MTDTGVDLTVVLATTGGVRAREDAIAALDAGCSGLASELIVVGPDAESLPPATTHSFRSVRTIPASGEVLVPRLWGAGAKLARGAVVALTTDQMRVGPAWGRTLHDAVEAGVAGAGGPIDLAVHAGPAVAAVYFARFASMMPGTFTGGSRVSDIAGDNAAYSRAALFRHQDLLADGLWEVEFHRRFEREGATLRAVDAARAEFVGPAHFAATLRRRYQHAREFGAARVRVHGASPTGILLRAPLVPVALIGRAARRAVGARRHRMRLVAALPWLVLLTGAWAAGEAAGAVFSVPSEGARTDSPPPPSSSSRNTT